MVCKALKIKKNYRFVPFRANLTSFGLKQDIPVAEAVRAFLKISISSGITGLSIGQKIHQIKTKLADKSGIAILEQY